MVVTGEMLAAKFAVILPRLDERQRRLVLAADARMPRPPSRAHADAESGTFR